MAQLLIHPAPEPGGRFQHVTPDSAGWAHVGFDAYALAGGQSAEGGSKDREICLVLVAGRAALRVDGVDFGTLGERRTPFEGNPWSVYVPAGARWQAKAEGDCELAVCSAPATAPRAARVIAPDAVSPETRGAGTNTRLVRNILPDTSDIAENLLVVEVVTPGGHWSSYPPHKHDTDNPPHETYLEETYYHRLARGSGFALQRVYTDDGGLDETMAVRDRDVVLVPRGYHPVGAPHGFDLYYLNVMAGPVKQWRFTMSPEHAFLTW